MKESDILLFEPQTTTTRPAYAVWVDEDNTRLIWGFRGTTDLNVSWTLCCNHAYVTGYTVVALISNISGAALHESPPNRI